MPPYLDTEPKAMSPIQCSSEINLGDQWRTITVHETISHGKKLREFKPGFNKPVGYPCDKNPAKIFFQPLCEELRRNNRSLRKRKTKCTFLKKKKQTKCSLRIAELAIPSKRQCLSSWKHNAHILPPIMIERLRQIVLDQKPMVYIKDAYCCFNKKNKKKSKQRAKKIEYGCKTELSKKKHDKLNENVQNLCTKFASEIYKILMKPNNDIYCSNLRNLYTIISTEIRNIMGCSYRKNKKIVNIHDEVTRKIAIWMADVLEHTECKILYEQLQELEDEEGPALDCVDDLIENVLNICAPICEDEMLDMQKILIERERSQYGCDEELQSQEEKEESCVSLNTNDFIVNEINECINDVVASELSFESYDGAGEPGVDIVSQESKQQREASELDEQDVTEEMVQDEMKEEDGQEITAQHEPGVVQDSEEIKEPDQEAVINENEQDITQGEPKGIIDDDEEIEEENNEAAQDDQPEVVQDDEEMREQDKMKIIIPDGEETTAQDEQIGIVQDDEEIKEDKTTVDIEDGQEIINKEDEASIAEDSQEQAEAERAPLPKAQDDQEIKEQETIGQDESTAIESNQQDDQDIQAGEVQEKDASEPIHDEQGETAPKIQDTEFGEPSSKEASIKEDGVDSGEVPEIPKSSLPSAKASKEFDPDQNKMEYDEAWPSPISPHGSKIIANAVISVASLGVIREILSSDDESEPKDEEKTEDTAISKPKEEEEDKIEHDDEEKTEDKTISKPKEEEEDTIEHDEKSTEEKDKKAKPPKKPSKKTTKPSDSKDKTSDKKDKRDRPPKLDKRKKPKPPKRNDRKRKETCKKDKTVTDITVIDPSDKKPDETEAKQNIYVVDLNNAPAWVHRTHKIKPIMKQSEAREWCENLQYVLNKLEGINEWVEKTSKEIRHMEHRKELKRCCVLASEQANAQKIFISIYRTADIYRKITEDLKWILMYHKNIYENLRNEKDMKIDRKRFCCIKKNKT